LEFKLHPCRACEAGASCSDHHPERMEITQPRVARNELSWDNRLNARYPERVTSGWQGSRGGTKKIRPFETREALENRHHQVSALALQLCLALESRRLNCNFDSAQAYTFHAGKKCANGSVPRNYLLNLRTFAPRTALNPMARRYPRERLLNSLPLLLWN